MKKGLQRENTNFNTIVIELRKKLITEYIRQGMSADEIFRITGFSSVNVLYAFCYNNFEVSYKHLRKVILSYQGLSHCRQPFRFPEIKLSYGLFLIGEPQKSALLKKVFTCDRI